MLTIDTLSHRLSGYLEPSQVMSVKRAYYYAEQAHMGQFRRSGEPYITHPLAVANILASVRMDHQSLMAAMLHDVIEDTGIPKSAITDQFGQTVAEIVDGVSKLAKIDFESQAEKQAKNFQKMALAMTKDLRVIVVKLSDRLHNMRTLGALSADKKRRIAKETLEIYAPIAHRLGMNDWRIEFEDRSFAATHPLRANRLLASLQEVRGDRKAIVDKIKAAIQDRLDRQEIDGLVIGREKHLYSIYSKMRAKYKSFREIMDVFAFRIIVDNIDDCYRTLGAIHNLFKPRPGEFKDYIAIPKENGYQSLHTVVVGSQGVPIEVQIRTKEMDDFANSGIAAHWIYKTAVNEESESLEGHDGVQRWVQRLLEINKLTSSSTEFVENVKIDLFRDEVYVFTPKGSIIELPSGATPVDFAYAVHTDVGNTCVACRIDDRPAPLSQVLYSGQKVKIITSGNTQPNPNWLNFVATAKARTAIRHYLKNQRHIESIELGKRMLNRSLVNLDMNLEQITDQQFTHVFEETKVESLEELFECIGMGKIQAFTIAQILKPDAELNSRDSAPITIDSADSLMVSFARCCRPIPGDPIIGHLSKGKGVVVHAETCKNAMNLRNQGENIANVNWSLNVTGEFQTGVRIEVRSERGIIATLAARVAQTGTSIEGIQVEERDAEHSVITLTLSVTGRVHLAQVMRTIKTMSSVTKVHRSKK
ncbi:bifunctional (p)ppGpp synthetase/guanosine-3',5'-bis(diphosphate) 3'-pyrophosphohydrolase [Teredinibacter sp. KSP-S5-2]|uniref:RelA/SpoT family protein n=1 Tax=Teredinibacter sp. KSP-S5-2 TaxID=3034506 RepID=UPI002934A25A|nr:bifunctional (p)ppGpp synthetase/guanosine-3',5'-bis(diphosphate) 3'-pyrophosphohydrolase [Teredinibacter sp. KSP-S5-2]WNO09291.1 bifunctional (p)ppGpp synthetase/guanosine-3',5'-bis(diphosphate) 3'-pyrophosphohydrolase [Teredinibacter sp. KSP-S5-2]